MAISYRRRNRYRINAILAFEGNPVTDHNRSELSVSPELIKQEDRMVNATLRRYYTATKRTWSVSWEDLFSKAQYTTDNYWSGEELLAFYNEHPGEFTMTITSGDGRTEEVLVMFDEFSYTISKRMPQCDMWNVDLSLVEV